ncbi:hypothetical protein Ctob_009776 [Chrysochromulina tobinii]|jgi:hypothetical protein|uniref:PDZ domain-containing protein n=1 Tax=Chrysochromulina tobinii TaxID=1460289 RepID=A0A0M0JQQ5_9EUKA|nr:hypothetical protein Ctob_009776 [Chrysochromulina tobinii]|eukprot:KOO28627.1 hypothetical protein Ctob_009776 [Chrysochromulina sp. CCMP291]
MPKDCYEIRLDKPLGIAFIENDDGGVVVEDLVEGGNAAKSGVIKPGDVLLGSTACMGRDGTFERKMIPVRYQDFDTISDDDPAVEPAAASSPITSLGVLSRLCSIPVCSWQWVP